MSLRDAQYTLENFQKASDLEIAQAESKVSNAKLALNDASNDWDQLKNIPDEQMFQAKAKVSSAKLSLTSAQNTLTQILAQPTEQELATAESKVTSARACLCKLPKSPSSSYKDHSQPFNWLNQKPVLPTLNLQNAAPKKN